ncbi:hypothetical protein FGO68_gene879 [Halteria grandinella]|uniref:Uncharacterized protein n=1 Tax=Halteria grandinella TaxID=5974 RepID=A0A8J8SXC0_HALGN|nr:hypothetical protein FGO68_gene879 [Halteria grandinella]
MSANTNQQQEKLRRDYVPQNPGDRFDTFLEQPAQEFQTQPSKMQKASIRNEEVVSGFSEEVAKQLQKEENPEEELKQGESFSKKEGAKGYSEGKQESTSEEQPSLQRREQPLREEQFKEFSKDIHDIQREERKERTKENQRIIDERDRAHGILAQEIIPPVGHPKDQIDQMKQEQDKAAMGFKNVEYRKLLKEQQMKEGTFGELNLEQSESRGSQFGYPEGSLLDRIAKCLSRKICRMLDKERVESSQGSRTGEDICRRDWEGQDNMQQFTQEQRKDLPTENRQLIPMPGHHVSDIEIEASSRIEMLLERTKSQEESGRPIRGSRDMKADKRSPSPERWQESSSGTSEEESNKPPSQQNLAQKKHMKDKGLKITDEDLKMLKEKSFGKKESSKKKKSKAKKEEEPESQKLIETHEPWTDVNKEIWTAEERMQKAKEPKFKVTREERRLEEEWNRRDEDTGALNEGNREM